MKPKGVYREGESEQKLYNDNTLTKEEKKHNICIYAEGNVVSLLLSPLPLFVGGSDDGGGGGNRTTESEQKNTSLINYIYVLWQSMDTTLYYTHR